VTTGEDNLNVLAATLGAYLAFQADERIPIPDPLYDAQELAQRLDRAEIGYPQFPIGSGRR
jgi:hypothetical protein